MNTDGRLKGKALNPRYESPADQMLPAEQLQDDFALVQLDTRFVTLLSEIFALESQHGQGLRDAESVRSDEASRRAQKIESVLARMDPIERAIMATPARTIVGLGIKARHAAYVTSGYWDVPIEHIDWDARAVRLLIEAICNVAGVPLPFPTNASQ